jgi:hypothetical protein
LLRLPYSVGLANAALALPASSAAAIQRAVFDDLPLMVFSSGNVGTSAARDARR